MIGAIFGDISGSRFEGAQFSGSTFAEACCAAYCFSPVPYSRIGEFAATCNLFEEHSSFTDDSVLTAAVAAWLLDGGELAGHLKHFAQLYPDAGYGKLFRAWALGNEVPHPGSHGNGAAMRVSPVAYAFETSNAVWSAARDSALPTHTVDHAMKGAEAIAVAVFALRQGKAKDVVCGQIADEFGYSFERPLDEIRTTSSFSSECPETVPVAFRALLEGGSFEDVIRRAISAGGDVDTIASMAGALAGEYYGVPKMVRDYTLSVLPKPLQDVVLAFEKRFPAARKTIA